VIGGGVAGLAVSLALAQDGHRVALLERDGEPVPGDPAEAFESWRRPGVPQSRHSHGFVARIRNLIRERAPGLFDALLAHGVEQVPFAAMVSTLVEELAPEPGDDEVAMLATRRTTFEWTLRRYVEGLPNVELSTGVECVGLRVERAAGTRVPRVTGVVLRDRAGGVATLAADLVIDAGGRRTRSGEWLAQAGVAPPALESSSCGIFYGSRFYERHAGVEPPARSGLYVGDLGYLRFGIFPADRRTFSLTLAGPDDDVPLRAVLDPQLFEVAVRTIPSLRPWVAPGVSRPISKVHGMADLENTQRAFVADGHPIALGFAAVGDSLIHTNPIFGWGCSLAFVNAYLLADALRANAKDLRAFALDLDARVRRKIEPYYKASVGQDADAIEIAAARRRGEDPYDYPGPDGSLDRKRFVRSLIHHGVMAVMHEDPVILRASLRAFNLLGLPDRLLERGDIARRVLKAWYRRGEHAPLSQGPARGDLLEQLQQAAVFRERAAADSAAARDE
jgi:2-polyprenyl-6-methoxyphenol hydroxylase-like FAD-dependent oxidoreductase